MSLKKNAAFLSALTGLIMLSGCVTKNNDAKTTAKTVTTETTKVNNANGKFINLTVEQKEKPTFDGYLEFYDVQEESLYKLYYFNIGKADGVAISTAESYRYTGVEIDVSYTIEESSQEGIQNSIEEATQMSVSASVMTGSCITKGEEDSNTSTSSYSLEDSQSIGGTVGASYSVSASIEGGFGPIAKGKTETTATISAEYSASTTVTDTSTWGQEFSKSKSVSEANSVESTKTREDSKSIAKAYETYKSSTYSKSTTATYHLAGDIEPGWYRYALFSLCEVYLVITLDETNHKAYIDYTMYPVADSFYYGIQYSSDGKYNDKIEERVSVNVEDVLDYLNYNPTYGLKKITFDGNGGETTTKQQYVKQDSKLGTVKTPTREGYEFAGWCTDKEGNNAFSLDTAITSDITLYAKWTPVKYQITYNLEGGTNNSSNVSQFTIEDEIILKDPTRANYDFKGWYTDSGLNNKVEKIEKGTKENVTLYAKWQKITKYYSLSFVSDIDTSAYHITTEPGTYAEGTTITLSLMRKGAISYKWIDMDTMQELPSTITMNKNYSIRVDYTYGG